MGISNEQLFSLSKNGYLSGKLFFKSLDNTNLTNTPCLIDAGSWDRNSSDVSVKFIFPRYIGNHIGENNVYHRSCLRKMDKTPFVYRNRIKIIEEFDFGRVQSLQSYVEVNDIITFQLWKPPITAYGFKAYETSQLTAESAVKFFKNLRELLTNKYRYNSCENYFVTKDHKCAKPEHLEYYITFISLFNCIPMFNRKKMDGMGLIINMIDGARTEEKGSLFSMARVALLMTNHLENKFMIDGVNIYDPHPIASSSLENLSNFVMKNTKVKAEDKIKSTEKKAKEAPKAYYTTSIPVFYASSSTTTSTY